MMRPLLPHPAPLCKKAMTIRHSFQIARPDGTGADDGNYVWAFSSKVTISASADDVSKVPVASTGTTYTANLTATVQSAV